MNSQNTRPDSLPYLTEAVLEEYYRVFDYEHLKHYDRRRIARLRGILERASVKVKSQAD